MPSQKMTKLRVTAHEERAKRVDDLTPEERLAKAFHTELDFDTLEESEDDFMMDQSIFISIARDLLDDGKTWRNHLYMNHFPKEKRAFAISYMEYFEAALEALDTKYFADNPIIAYDIIESSNLAEDLKYHVLKDLEWRVTQQFSKVEDPIKEAREHRNYVVSKGQEDEKTITGGNERDEGGRKRVTEERGNLKRLAVSFPGELVDAIQARADKTGSSLSKAVVDMVGERVRADNGEYDTVTLNLPPTLSPDLRRSLEAMAQTMRDLIDGSYDDHDM